MRIDLESLADFDARVSSGGSLAGVFVQSVDLTGRSAALRSSDVTGAVFLGCALRPADASHLSRHGALVFPRPPDLPFDPYRPELYTADELYRGLEHGYPATVDAAIFGWQSAQLRPGGLEADLAAALHDHSITEALQQELAGTDVRRVVGIMGGHAQHRGSGPYRASAELAHRLAGDGYVVISGGGPGAMEAANLGAAFEGSDADLRAAIDELAAAASWSVDVTAWARSAQQIVRRYGCGRLSLGVPTWFYGHEPPNLFATRIAKFFTNALREDVLLRVCRGGLIYLPGAAGTVQEVFQAVTPNFYAADGEPITPLVLVGSEYWTDVVPVWPLLHALAAGRRMAGAISLVDSTAEALAAISAAGSAGPPSTTG
ncbi:MAG: Rossmann fold nucleotide-binding protein [Micropruina sp.]|uniref:LOG family protein n=1 Tax=Micropruina sp. TaxID=2737536 RepID=UPI0039E2A20D